MSPKQAVTVLHKHGVNAWTDGAGTVGVIDERADDVVYLQTTARAIHAFLRYHRKESTL